MTLTISGWFMKWRRNKLQKKRKRKSRETYHSWKINHSRIYILVRMKTILLSRQLISWYWQLIICKHIGKLCTGIHQRRVGWRGIDNFNLKWETYYLKLLENTFIFSFYFIRLLFKNIKKIISLNITKRQSPDDNIIKILMIKILLLSILLTITLSTSPINEVWHLIRKDQ